MYSVLSVIYLAIYMFIWCLSLEYSKADNCAVKRTYCPREKGYSFTLDYFNAVAIVVTVGFIEQPLEGKRQT